MSHPRTPDSIRNRGSRRFHWQKEENFKGNLVGKRMAPKLLLRWCASSSRVRNRSQRSEGGRDSFPGETMSEWFERFGRSSLCRGKNEPVPEQ